MTNTLAGVVSKYETPLQRWPQVNFLHPNTINLICDASTIFSKTDNTSSNAVVASAIIKYVSSEDNYMVDSFKPISINSHNPSFSELVSILVGLENIHLSDSKKSNHNNINIFTDSITAFKKVSIISHRIQTSRIARFSVSDMLDRLVFDTDLEQAIAYYLITFNVETNVYHLKGHTNNMSYIIKDFIHYNQINPNREELEYIAGVHSLVDSVAIKHAQN